MRRQSILPLVLAHANAGAVEEARRLFVDAGLEDVEDDPAVLAIRGRLTKEQARRAESGARAPLYAQAAEAYAAAGGISGSTHHLINAASLWRLAGDSAASDAVAVRVLDSLDENPEEPETPYWRGATRAEALLLLGRTEAARQALTEAMALAPRAYEDHAPTLRQFRLLCEAMGESVDWLEAFAPPRSLHFAGHMGVRADDADLRATVRRVLAEERVGFGFGALAAGADIVVVEELLAAGIEVDLVLPSDPEAFRAVSVAGLGADWARRYDLVMGAGVELKVVGDGRPSTPATLQLAAETAMGLAAMRAQSLQSEALQLVVLDADTGRSGEPGGADWARANWAATGRRQVVAVAPRESGPSPETLQATTDRLAALLAVEVGAERLNALADVLVGRGDMLVPPSWAEGSLLLAFPNPAPAADAAREVRRILGPAARMAAHYGVVACAGAANPGVSLIAGPAVDLPRAILRGAPTGAWHVSETFAAGLSAARTGDRPILVGELSGLPIMAL